MSMTTIRPIMYAMLAVATVAAPAHAQEAADGRWLPFVGCWEAVGAEEEIGLLCFDIDEGGVLLTNYVDGDVATTERLVADGQQRPVSVEGCEGWETVEFSEDGRRAFTRTEFLCEDEEPRAGTGVMAFTAPNRWADVRALDVSGENVAWVQEYLLVGIDRLAEEGVEDPAAGRALPVRAARMAASAAIDIQDVEEASARMDARAVETWIVTQHDRLDPSADDLVRLADAGVSDAVIDAVVAVSHPDRFMVEASGPIEEVASAPRPTHYRGYMAFNPFYGPRWGIGVGYGWAYDPFWYGVGYGYGYAGAPWGYPGYGYGYGYWGTRPGYVIIDRRPSGGRVYNDRGYSRGSGSTGRIARPRSGGQPSYSRGGGASTGRAAPASGGRTATPRRRGGEASTGSAATSSGSRSSTGRTAKPRRRGG